MSDSDFFTAEGKVNMLIVFQDIAPKGKTVAILHLQYFLCIYLKGSKNTTSSRKKKKGNHLEQTVNAVHVLILEGQLLLSS